MNTGSTKILMYTAAGTQLNDPVLSHKAEKLVVPVMPL